jgi:hypothetical protein
MHFSNCGMRAGACILFSMGQWLTQAMQRVSDLRSRALVYALLVAFIAQGIATTSHVHAGWTGTAPDSVAAHLSDGHAVASADTHRSADHVTQCPLCQLSARAGSFIAVETVSVIRAAGTVSAPRAGPIEGIARHVAVWRSRAPPIL